MASKGLVRSGELYKPTIWNDSGVYTYFYIDFRRTVRDFSLGMFNESIIVYDSQQISVSQIEKIGATVYKVYCDLSNKIHGITVLNKKTTRLRFSSGEILPVFSVHMFIGGQSAFVDGAYVYEKLVFSTAFSETEAVNVAVSSAFTIPALYDSLHYTANFGAVTDTATVRLV